MKTPISLTRRMQHRAALCARSLVCGLTLVTPAFGYRTAGELPEFEGTERVKWTADAVHFEMFEDLPGEIPGSTAATIITESFAVWNETNCDQAFLEYTGTSDEPAEAGDGRNTIEWVSSGWEDRGFDASGAAAADVQYEKQDGEWVIVEADLYLNAEAHAWILDRTALSSDDQDLKSVLVHESGHVLGLLHTCEPDGADGAPECLPSSVYGDPTMYPYESPTQASLTSNDIAGLCFLYEEPANCQSECTADCAADGGCEAPVSPDGDPCADDGACASGVCDGGYCIPACSTADDCGEGETCSERRCVGGRGELGASCSVASDCYGNQCLAGVEEDPICTRTCSERDPCPTDWDCIDVNDRLVCAPLVPAPMSSVGSCSVVGVPVASGPSALSPLLLAAWLLRRARRHQSLTPSRPPSLS